VDLIVRPAALAGRGCSFSSCGVEMGRVACGLGDALFETLPRFDRSKLKLIWSGGSMVVGVDSVSGPPDLDFADEHQSVLTGRTPASRQGSASLSVIRPSDISHAPCMLCELVSPLGPWLRGAGVDRIRRGARVVKMVDGG